MLENFCNLIRSDKQHPTTCVFAAIAAALTALLATDVSAEILSAKRGFADTGANYNNLQATGAGWYYTWGTGVGNPGNFDAEHYPMFWNAPSQNTINNVKSRNPEYVLGFNEPERPDQANMTVAQAISSWTTISNSFTGTNTKLVSPAVSDTGDGQAWLSSFMQQATAANLKVDAVAFHWYGVSNPNNPAGAASSFLSRVDSYHNQYNKPVFITEFAIHDWGGAYTDAEIIEANRQFLNIVVPGLESRSHVAGYSWYHWFSDAPLYSGNPSTPTQMAYNYVGAVGTGQVANIGGQNLGEHVAYLAGGTLTMTGGTPGTIRYINALSGASTVAGGMDWGLTGTGWVRIESGATLRKTGANQITFNGGTVTNNGLLEVSQGTLRLSATVTGSGNVRIAGGTLVLPSTGRLPTAPLIDIRSGGVFDVSDLSSPYTVSIGRTLNNEHGGMVVGNVLAATGATISGGGIFAGNLTADSGSIVRVGKDGSGIASRFVIDNFESYALGDVLTTASPPWAAHQNSTLVDIENFSGTKVLTYGWAGGARGTSRGLPEPAVIDNNETATLFFRINSKTDDPDHNFGLSDLANTGAADFGDFEAQLRLKQGTSAGTFALDARSGGGFSATLASGLALNSWYNIWMVVNQTTDTYDIYMNTGIGAATAANKLNASPLSFRNGTASPLNTILGLANTAPIDNGVRIDDLVYLTGIDLTNPVAGFDPGLIWTAETLAVTGSYTQIAGSTLEINLGGSTPGTFDVLDVTSIATLDGSLNIGFANGFTPTSGDLFPILNAADVTGTLALTGQSSGFWLLPTANGMSLYFGPLPTGDYDQNGIVNAADYDVWNAAFGSNADLTADGNGDGIVDTADFVLWRKNVGATVFPAGAGSATSLGNSIVPEPSTALMAFCAAIASLQRIARRRCS